MEEKEKTSQSGNGLMSLIQVLTLILVCAMTIAKNPIKEAVDAISNKYKIEAHKETCDQIADNQNVYEDHVVEAFSVGCISTIKVQLIKWAKTKKEVDTINKSFQPDGSLKFLQVKDFCDSLSQRWKYQQGVKAKVMGDLGDKFKCWDIWNKEGRINE